MTTRKGGKVGTNYQGPGSPEGGPGPHYATHVFVLVGNIIICWGGGGDAGRIFSPGSDAALGSPVDNAFPRAVDANNAFLCFSSRPCVFTFCTEGTLRRMQATKLRFLNNFLYRTSIVDIDLPQSLHTTPNDDYE